MIIPRDAMRVNKGRRKSMYLGCLHGKRDRMARGTAKFVRRKRFSFSLLNSV
ncbi:MAG: hypothetical protein ACE5HW_04805 [Candidatus Methanofastidiosia archaeon]